MKIKKYILISCIAMLCTGAFGACGTSTSNPCYTNITRNDGTIIRRGYYYPNGYGTSVSVSSVTVQGCADGYYMPTNAPRPKCTGGTTTWDEIAIDECCWPCPFDDQGTSTQECYYLNQGSDQYVSECDYDWCRSSKANKDPYGGVSTCLLKVDPDIGDVVYGSDKTGQYEIGSACGFSGNESDISNPCKCWPRSSYTDFCG